MNRRITIFDRKDCETTYLKWYTLGLGDEIYAVQDLLAMKTEDRERILKIETGDAVMVASAEGWKMLRDRYHFGVRNEGFVDCQQLKRLSIEGGAYLKLVPHNEFPKKEVVSEFMSPGFTNKVKFPGFKQKVLKTIEEAENYMRWADSQPLDTNWGFDYEASG